MSDMTSILGLILLAFTWLALRGMGSEQKHPHHHPRRPDSRRRPARRTRAHAHAHHDAA